MYKKSKSVIYIGESVRGTILKKFAVFSDGIPAEYKEHSIYKHLFVPIEKLNASIAEINRTGSMLNTFYKQSLKAKG